MIEIQGQMSSIYISYQIISKKTEGRNIIRENKGQSKITRQVIIIGILQNQEIQNEWNNTIIIMDGQSKITKGGQIIETYQQIQIIQMMEIITISKIKSEIYQIIMSGIIGMKYQQNSNDQIIIITAWEQQNQSQYQMVSMQGAKSNKGGSQSAGIKYFQQSAQTTGIQQIGIAILYSQTGSTNQEIQKIMIPYQKETTNGGNGIQEISIIAISITQIFKQAAAPFHNWAPDLYESIPTPIAMWIAIIPKITQQIQIQNNQYQFQIVENLWIQIGIISLIIGSIGLGEQWKVFRFIAYSAISHLGFQILSIITESPEGAIYYLFIYGINSLLFFAIIIGQNKSYGQIKNKNMIGSQSIKQQGGIYKQNPAIGLSFAQALFSFAGIPPLAGFFAKQQVIEGIISHNLITIAIIIVITSAISTGNYLSLIKISLFDLPITKGQTIKLEKNQSNIISILTSFIIFFYIKPSIILSNSQVVFNILN